MKTVRFPKLIALLPLACALALGTLLRAAEPPATPPADQKPEAVQPAPAPVTPAAAPEQAAPVPAAPAAAPAVQPGNKPAPDQAVEIANQMAEKARAEAERIAEKAQADAEKVAAEARENAERTAEKARADAEKLAEAAQADAAKAAEEAARASAESEKIIRPIKPRSSNQGDRVVIMDDNHVAAGTRVDHDAVAVMGDLTVDGEVMHDAVAVMGDNVVNGRVHHDTIVIMGNLTLGPKAIVDGNIVCVGGEIHRDPGATVNGRVEVQQIGSKFNPVRFSNWWNQGLKLGRPLAIGAHLGWLWVITAFSVAFYALLGLIFPGKIRTCGDKLVQEPGMAILAGLLGVLALPVLFVLLCITIIGIPVALFVLPMGTLLIAMFGKAAIYGLVGRRLTGDKLHPALTIILGALVFVLLYLVPLIGLLLSLLVWFLGFGCAVLSIFSKTPKPAVGFPSTPGPASPATAALAVPVVAETAAAVAAAEPPPLAAAAPAVEAAPAPAPTPAPRVPITADTLPRAGFWIRLAAAFLDFMLVMISLLVAVHALLHTDMEGPGLMFLSVAAYHAVMWKLKGTTIGGIICNLKVVRLDDKPIDWGVAIARALTGFLSFIVAGLGFIWVAFDDSKQSWHDKVAGTTIVRVPRGTPLL
jgi:uncharacterized RDD family membrane protein YckC/cytoskeletal protein CcmA (bactofilin family)